MIGLALVWLLFVLEALMVPSQFCGTAKLVALLVVLGAVVYAGFWIFDRKERRPAFRPLSFEYAALHGWRIS